MYHEKKAGSAMTDIEILSVVAMLEDLPEHGLVRGQVGTVVEIGLLTFTRWSSATTAEGRMPWLH
jgi:hypothetical protein